MVTEIFSTCRIWTQVSFWSTFLIKYGLNRNLLDYSLKQPLLHCKDPCLSTNILQSVVGVTVNCPFCCGTSSLPLMKRSPRTWCKAGRCRPRSSSDSCWWAQWKSSLSVFALLMQVAKSIRYEGHKTERRAYEPGEEDSFDLHAVWFAFMLYHWGFQFSDVCVFKILGLDHCIFMLVSK